MKPLRFLTLAGLILFAQAALAAIPTFDQVKAGWQPSDAVLLDRHGEVVHEMRIDLKGRRLQWTPLANISPALVTTLIQAEDKRFYLHHGVDWKALMGAAIDTLIAGKERGASTLTMQLAGLLDPELMPRHKHRSLTQKWDQIQAARELEKTWSKPQILEAYLNLAGFRGELQGVAATAKGLFDKTPDGLNDAESLLLSALLRAPNAAPGAVAKRACLLAVTSGAKTSCDTIHATAAATLDRAYAIPPDVALAPQVARQLMKKGELSTRSALDADLQYFATQALYDQLRQLAGSHVQEGAVLAVDNRSGEVLAYVSGGPYSRNPFVDGVLAPRQAGSTLKPFLYGLALEKRLLTAASPIDDAPVNLATPNGLYVPQNYDKDFKGLVSARMALGSSLNVPAVKTLMLVGEDAFVERLRQLGYAGLTENGDYYGYSLALGSAEVSLWQEVAAYRALAGGGVYSPLTLVPGGGVKGAKLMDRDAAFIVTDILSDRNARSLTFGLESPLATRYWSAVKTGTSKDMRDNWCIGFSDRYTVGVWVGNFDGSPMRDVSGVSGAAPVWLEVMNRLNREAPSRAPTPPAGVVAVDVSFDPPVEAPRREWFLVGTETDKVTLAQPSVTTSRISYPGSEEILALDPDIPLPNQRVLFEMTPFNPALRWKLDDHAPEGPGYLWQPQPGRHVLTLVDKNSKELDRVVFEVRGSLPAKERR